MLRELYSQHPEYRHHEAWELQWLLFALGYTNSLQNEAEIAAAVEIARTDYDPEEETA
jgi:hypothetical protein